MKLQLIRNATMRLEYAGRRILTDPYLAPRHSRPSYAGRSPNPLVELPCPLDAVLAGAELLILSHLHSDHFDPLAQERVPRELDIFCQPCDTERLHALGFTRAVPVSERVEWQGVTITRTPGQHGSGQVLAEMGEASGFVLEAAGEPTVYWAGDTIWTEDVAACIQRHRADVIITHSCGAVWGDGVLIVMDAAQTVTVAEAAPAATVVAIHMEAVDHATVSRAGLREFATAHGVDPDRLRIPPDGAVLELTRPLQA